MTGTVCTNGRAVLAGLGGAGVDPLSSPKGDAERPIGAKRRGFPKRGRARVWNKPISAPYTYYDNTPPDSVI